jgi:hypothetical protein
VENGYNNLIKLMQAGYAAYKFDPNKDEMYELFMKGVQSWKGEEPNTKELASSQFSPASSGIS